MPKHENYFDPEWVKSRHGVVRELREYVEHGPPEQKSYSKPRSYSANNHAGRGGSQLKMARRLKRYRPA